MKEKGQITPLKSLIYKLIWAFAYIAILFSLCFSGITLFEKTNYILTYVEGQSMSPTLNNRSQNSPYNDCGLVDENKNIKQYLERFDVVITYYSQDYYNGVLNNSASKKVKRLYGFPGEKIELGVDEYNKRYLRVNDEFVDLPFDVNLPEYQGADANHKHFPSNNKPFILGENEYFVVGDNWKNSSDSTHKNVGSVTIDMISGILIKIIGYCTLDSQGNINEIFKTTPRYFK